MHIPLTRISSKSFTVHKHKPNIYDHFVVLIFMQFLSCKKQLWTKWLVWQTCTPHILALSPYHPRDGGTTFLPLRCESVVLLLAAWSISLSATVSSHYVQTILCLTLRCVRLEQIIRRVTADVRRRSRLKKLLMHYVSLCSHRPSHNDKKVFSFGGVIHHASYLQGG